jgi:hypothetical protein
MARVNKRGPRTAAGKIRSSLNALRHGLAATHRRHALPMQAVERLAQAICDGHDGADGALLAAARSIAENAFVLSTIRQQKIVVIERLKDATTIALRKGDNSFTLAKARFLEAWLAYREIQKLVPPALKKYEAQMLPPIPGVDWRNGTDDIVPIRLKALLEEPTQEDEERGVWCRIGGDDIESAGQITGGGTAPFEPQSRKSLRAVGPSKHNCALLRPA